MALEVNSLLHNRYRIREKLASGGMGAVYRGFDESLGVEVAIKENLFVSPEAGRQFEREAKLLASLRHPNLPRVTDHFVIPDQGQYLVMDFVPGETAYTLLKRKAGPLVEGEVVRWADQLLSALEYMHSRPQPVIHRDIKPGNIKILPGGDAILVDFGLAKEHRPAEKTTKGARALTPGFAPPEQYGHGRTDMRTDVFSLGATLYALITTQIPADSIKREMGIEVLTPVRQLNPEVSQPVAEAIETALRTKPEERFQSAETFRRALLIESSARTRLATPSPRESPAAATVLAGQRVGDPGGSPPARSRIRSLPFLLGGLGLVAVLVLGGIFLRGILTRDRGTAVNPPQPPQTSAPPQTLEFPGFTTPDHAGSPPSPTTPAIAPASTTDSPPTESVPLVQPTAIGGGRGQIAFVSEREGLPQIYSMGVDGSNQVRLTELSDGACQPAWSPDGEKILFVSPCRGKSDVYPNAAIYIMDADGGQLQPWITKLGGAFDPDWSTVGILFTHLDNTKPRIWLSDASGGGLIQISKSNAADREPSWSPTGDRIALVNTSRTGAATIYWVFADGSYDGSNPDQITRDLVVSSPDWSPAGELIAYETDGQIWVTPWDALGYGAVQLTVLAPNKDPDWSPDGKWIAFESWREAANHDIYIMADYGGQQTRLTDDPALDYQPAWRP